MEPFVWVGYGAVSVLVLVLTTYLLVRVGSYAYFLTRLEFWRRLRQECKQQQGRAL